MNKPIVEDTHIYNGDNKGPYRFLPVVVRELPFVVTDIEFGHMRLQGLGNMLEPKCAVLLPYMLDSSDYTHLLPVDQPMLNQVHNNEFVDTGGS